MQDDEELKTWGFRQFLILFIKKKNLEKHSDPPVSWGIYQKYSLLAQLTLRFGLVGKHGTIYRRVLPKFRSCEGSRERNP